MANAAAAAQYQRTIDEIVGQHIVTLYAPSVRAQVAKFSKRANDETHTVFESLHVRSDETTFPVQVSVTSVREDAVVLYRVATLEDITRRRLAESELAARIKDNDLLLASVSEGLQFLNADLTVRWINESMAAMFGYKPEEMTVVGNIHEQEVGK